MKRYNAVGVAPTPVNSQCTARMVEDDQGGYVPFIEVVRMGEDYRAVLDALGKHSVEAALKEIDRREQVAVSHTNQIAALQTEVDKLAKQRDLLSKIVSSADITITLSSKGAPTVNGIEVEADDIATLLAVRTYA